MGGSYRVNRVRELLVREMSDIIRNLKDPRIRFVTVVDAEITRDLRYAKVFVSVLGDEGEKEQAMEGLGKALGYIRRQVGQRISLRVTPEIKVVYDQTTERAARLTALIDSLDVDGDGAT